jgi:hypothetical protein
LFIANSTAQWAYSTRLSGASRQAKRTGRILRLANRTILGMDAGMAKANGNTLRGAPRDEAVASWDLLDQNR